jgi:UDP-N-acetyl-2-amino-2-deoxyglucuronate dehydrogenase
MKDRIRFALMTYGKVARLHAHALAALPNAELIAVWGRDAAKREAFAGEFGIAAYADVDRMVRESSVDAVIVASPHPQHREHTLAAIAAGAHVIVEKPMALTAADCDAMIQAADSAKRKLAVISQRRWYPSVRRVRDAIDSGKLGEPALAQVTMLGWRDEAYYRSDPWRGIWAGEGGGVLVNQAPHLFDLLGWYMGKAEEVSAYWGNVNHPYIEVEDTAVASVRFSGGRLASIFVSNSQKPGIYAKVHVHGRNGFSAGVQTDGGAMFVAGSSGVAEPPENDIWTIPGEEGNLEGWKEADTAFFKTIDATEYFHALQFADFADSIAADRTPAVTGEDGRATVALFEAVYRSGKEGRPVRIP